MSLKDGLPDMDPNLLDRVIDAGHPVEWSCPHILESDQDTLKLSSDEFRILIKIIRKSTGNVEFRMLSQIWYMNSTEQSNGANCQKKLKTSIWFVHFCKANICLWVKIFIGVCEKSFPGTKQFLRTLTKPID